MDRKPIVGLLAIQGDFAMHRHAVESLGYESAEVRTVDQLRHVDCLIMPGGESTTMRKIMKLDGLWEAIPQFTRSHAVMGTCAGLILLGRTIVGGKDWEDTLGLIDIDVDRNAYGSQYHSFRSIGYITLNGTAHAREMVFIRAPQIVRVGSGVAQLGEDQGLPTIVRQGNILALTFHPEMTGDLDIHAYFIEQMAIPQSAQDNSKAA